MDAMSDMVAGERKNSLKLALHGKLTQGGQKGLVKGEGRDIARAELRQSAYLEKWTKGFVEKELCPSLAFLQA